MQASCPARSSVVAAPFPTRAPLLLERQALWRWEIAVPRPAGRQRQPAEAALGAAEQCKHPRGDAGRHAVKPRAAGEQPPERETVADGRRRKVAFKLALAPASH